jgi:hypothetical protein
MKNYTIPEQQEMEQALFRRKQRAARISYDDLKEHRIKI